MDAAFFTVLFQIPTHCKQKTLMKTRFIILALALIAVATLNTYAQESPELRIKVLPSRPGYAKVLYAMQNTDPVTVRFIRNGEVLFTDRITSGPYEKGFQKWYNVEKLGKKDCIVEINDGRTSVSYRIVPFKNSAVFVAHLEHVSYHDAYTASK